MWIWNQQEEKKIFLVWLFMINDSSHISLIWIFFLFFFYKCWKAYPVIFSTDPLLWFHSVSLIYKNILYIDNFQIYNSISKPTWINSLVYSPSPFRSLTGISNLTCLKPSSWSSQKKPIPITVFPSQLTAILYF